MPRHAKNNNQHPESIAIETVTTGVKNLDWILGGGLLKGSLYVIGVPPGLGKTILSQQICFHNAGPGIVAIDGFRAFGDLALTVDEQRKFSYEIAVHLMAQRITSLLIGEYDPTDYKTNSMLSIADGLITLKQREAEGISQRFIQAFKIRGRDHSRAEHPFEINKDGVDIFVHPKLIRRETPVDPEMITMGISKLDELTGGGITAGSCILVGGAAGTGKTAFLMEFIHRGLQRGEKGIYFNFQENQAQILSASSRLGFGLEQALKEGRLEIIHIPHPEIQAQKDLGLIKERIFNFKPKRVALDSLSMFLDKIDDALVYREKVYQLISLMQNTGAVGFFAADIAYGSNQISRLGVEETLMDGIILLSAVEEGLERHRYLEIYKLRNSNHLRGRHNMEIAKGGIQIYPRYNSENQYRQPPPSVHIGRRMGSGVPGLDELLHGGFLERSATLVSGSAGIGKSVFAIQFILEGARNGEPGLYISPEEGPQQVVTNANSLGPDLEATVEKGLVEVLYLPSEQIRAAQFLTILTEKIKERKICRLAMDSINLILETGMAPHEIRQMIYNLIIRFKILNVTSVLTADSSYMRSIENPNEGGFAPIKEACGSGGPCLWSGANERLFFLFEL